MSSRGSKLSRAVSFFREGELDEVRVAFQLVKEVVEQRLSESKTQKHAVKKPRQLRLPFDKGTKTPQTTSITESTLSAGVAEEQAAGV